MSLYLTELKVKAALEQLDNALLCVQRRWNNAAEESIHRTERILHEIIDRPQENDHASERK